MIQQRATLYADKAHIPPEIFAVRNDTGRELVAEIADYTIPSGAAAEIRATLPDGTTATAAGTIDGQTVTAPLDDLLTAEGKAAAQIRITNGGEVTTFSFFVDVTEDLAGDTEEATAGPAEVATFETDAALPLTSLVVEIDPKQDLNGYEKPWPAGGGKNKLDPSTITLAKMTVADGIYTATDGDTRDPIMLKLQFYNGNTLIRTDNLGTVTAPGVVTKMGPIPEGTTRLRFANNGATSEFNMSIPLPSSIPALSIFTFYIEVVDATAGASKYKNPMLVAGELSGGYEPYANVCPITGTESVKVTKVGKNLLPRTASGTQTSNGVTFTVNADGSVTMNGTATAAINWAYSVDAPVRLDGDYIISGINGGSASTWRFGFATKDASGTQSPWVYVNNDEQARTITGAASIFRFVILIADGTTLDNVTVYPMIRREDDTDPTYQPYTGETLTTDLGRTVYGGTLDLVTGKLTVTHATDFISSWTSCWVSNPGGEVLTVKAGLTNTPKMIDDSTPAIGCYGISNQFEWFPYDNAYNLKPSLYSIRANSSYPSAFSLAIVSGAPKKRIVIKDSSCASVADYNSKYGASNPVQVVYELATPQTYQLTPAQILALLGGNTIWSDAGQVTVKYRRREAAG